MNPETIDHIYSRLVRAFHWRKGHSVKNAQIDAAAIPVTKIWQNRLGKIN
jgi:hypothetical protein